MSKRRHIKCWVPQCETKYSKIDEMDNISFHKLPKDNQRRHQWLKLLKMDRKSVTKHVLVCSKHFLNQDYFVGCDRARKYLKGNAIPSLNLPVTLITEGRKNLAAVKEREMRATKRSLEREDKHSTKMDKDEPDLKRSFTEKREAFHSRDRYLNRIELQTESSEIQPGTTMHLLNMKTDRKDKEIYIESADLKDTEKSMESHQLGECSMCRGTGIADNSKKIMIDKAVQVVEETCSKTIQVQRKSILSDFLDTDSKLNTVTGVTSFENLEYLETAVKKVNDENELRKSTFKLKIKDQIILTLTKLKLNISFACLAILFRVSRQTCTYDFYAMLTLLNAVLSCIIRWPSRNEILDNTPKCFKSFPSTRLILDATEIPIQSRKCLKCKIATYSHYKKGHTVKFILGITPSGLISFISNAYGGRASDKQIVIESGILDKLTYGEDSVMCDKGILIDVECRKRKVKLIRPFVKRKIRQFSTEQANINQKIASARVHVERCIQRIKLFKILKGPLSWDMVPSSPEIMQVICGIVNLSPPILKKDKFL